MDWKNSQGKCASIFVYYLVCRSVERLVFPSRIINSIHGSPGIMLFVSADAVLRVLNQFEYGIIAVFCRVTFDVSIVFEGDIREFVIVQIIRTFLVRNNATWHLPGLLPTKGSPC